MRYKTFILVLCLSLTGLGLGPLHQKVIDQTTGSVLRITRGDQFCTGFVIAPERVLTASHCLMPDMTADGLSVQVLKVDPFYDLALLNVSTKKVPLRIQDAPIQRGDAVTAIGYGFGYTMVTVIEARVMLVNYQIPPTEDQNYPPFIFVQNQYIGGMSGGPVIDTNGLVVGIVQISGQGVGLGVGTLIIRAFLLGT